MLRIIAAAPSALAARALADGSSGTLGADSVGSHELRRGGVTLDRLSDLSGGVLIGRAPGSEGPPQALDAQAARGLISAGAPGLQARDHAEAQTLAPDPDTVEIRTLGHVEPGDLGGARYAAAAGDPGHPGAFQTSDARWWRLAEAAATPQVFGAAGDGSGDDGPAIADALAWQAAEGGGVWLAGTYAVSARLDLGAFASLQGVAPRRARIRLGATGAQLKIGGSGASAKDCGLSRFDIDGADVAASGLVLSEDERASPSPLGWSVYTGGARVTDLRVTGCAEAGVVVGADSDDSQFHMLTSTGHQGAGTSADAIRVESPSHYVQCLFGGCTGYALRADVAASASETPEMVYTVDSSRLNFARRGLIHHDGRSDSGVGGAIGVFDKCFLENCGISAGGAGSVKEPVDEVALEPAAVHCAGGRLVITDPKKVQSGWARSLVKASGAGAATLRLSGCEVIGASAPALRDCTLFVAGLAAGHSARIHVDGRVDLADPAQFREIARVAPRAGDFPLHAAGVETLWTADPGSLSGWTATGGSASVVTEPARTLSAGAALSLQGSGAASDAHLATALVPRRAGGRIILLQAVMKGEKTAEDDVLGLACRLEGPGLVATTAPADEIPWTRDVGGFEQGYGVWTHLCAAAYVADPDAEVEVRLYSGRSQSGAVSAARAHVGLARILML